VLGLSLDDAAGLTDLVQTGSSLSSALGAINVASSCCVSQQTGPPAAMALIQVRRAALTGERRSLRTRPLETGLISALLP
jgi:hypothetical protein